MGTPDLGKGLSPKKTAAPKGASHVLLVGCLEQQNQSVAPAEIAPLMCRSLEHCSHAATSILLHDHGLFEP